MSTVELRHIISEYLTYIDDNSFLTDLKTIIESKIADGTYKLSDSQKLRIDLGREQLKNGLTIPDESLKMEVEKWLSTK